LSAGRAQRLSREERLRRAEEFRVLFRRGLRSDGPLFLLIASGGAGQKSRVGLVVSAKLGPAVRRNRAKRRLRECFRHRKPDRPLDILLVPKRELLGATQAELEHEYERRLSGLARRLAAAAPALRRD
jgi:ribonuclease P protein component